MQKLLFSLSIISIGLAVGYFIQRLVRGGIIPGDPNLKSARRTLQKIALLGLNPVAALGAIWVFQLDNIRIALMPAMGLLTLVTGGAVALALAKILRLPSRQAGAFFAAGGMFNIGSIGALIFFIFLGERGFALVPLFRLLEEFTYYAFGFPVAKSFSPHLSGTDQKHRLVSIIRDPFVLMAIGSISLGFLLNLLGVPRPGFYGALNTVVIPTASLLLLISIGMAMRFGRIVPYLHLGALVGAIKFLIVPGVVTGTAFFLGMGSFDDALPLKVILILSSMPVGFIALVPPSIYDLDVDLANAAWMVTTALLAVVIPIQMAIIALM
jgi:predicted permease